LGEDHKNNADTYPAERSENESNSEGGKSSAREEKKKSTFIEELMKVMNDLESTEYPVANAESTNIL